MKLLDRFVNAFAGKPEAADEKAALPTSIELALKSFSAVQRGHHDSGEPRILLHTSFGSWYHSGAETQRRLAAGWPHLTVEQLGQACDAVDGLARLAIVQAHASVGGEEPARWADWKPLRNLQ